MKDKSIIALTGGIGSGKTVVARILRTMGYEVYDCDERARGLMESDRDIKRAIIERITPEGVDGEGHLDRRVIAAVVFNEPEKLERLNAIVHKAVKTDFERWAQGLGAGKHFFETAILGESGMDRYADEIWVVTAPEEERLLRLTQKRGIAASDAKARMKAQRGWTLADERSREIKNDGRHSLIGQIERLLTE